jgi:hypothetical protein
LTALRGTARVFSVTASIESTFDEYTRLYSARDVEGVTNLCLWPFFAVRRGEAIYMPDRAAVRDHFANAIIAYRVTTGTVAWTPVEIDARPLGEHSVFATLHWNAVDADGPGSPRHVDELPTAHHSGRVALPLVHESLLRAASTAW